MKRFLFIGIFIMYMLSNAYVFFNYSALVRESDFSVKVLFGVIALTMSLSILIFYSVGKRMPVYLASYFYRIGTGWLMLSIYAFMLCLLFDIGALINHFTQQSTLFIYDHYSSARGSLLILLTLVIAFIGHITYLKKKRKEIVIKVNKKLPKELRFVLLTDLHLGYAIEHKELNKWVDTVNAECADAVLIAGDVIDVSLIPLQYYKLDEVLKKFKSEYGTYACLGNHEYLAGVEGSITFLKSAGINILRDQVKVLDDINVNLIGRDDKTNRHRKELGELMKGIEEDKLNILLDHQPYALENAVNNRVDIQCSGHTHRGQMWPVSWITDRLFENSHGYLKKEDTHIYVSSGVGIWGGRYRIGTVSEYVVIRVQGI
ncbi:metallophosphoesterase [Myroides odoratimimus]|uniref:metallophosphoesterase n=1 Tax=Myroides odoratimimus TaxID=76832 RepID=UPI0025758598|nr:metallophosphoesterase [Myroides odoratimimus]MDM1494912.1 metallophosphoesterase [Myroides odoratimimus]